MNNQDSVSQDLAYVALVFLFLISLDNFIKRSYTLAASSLVKFDKSLEAYCDLLRYAKVCYTKNLVLSDRSCLVHIQHQNIYFKNKLKKKVVTPFLVGSATSSKVTEALQWWAERGLQNIKQQHQQPQSRKTPKQRCLKYSAWWMQIVWLMVVWYWVWMFQNKRKVISFF